MRSLRVSPSAVSAFVVCAGLAVVGAAATAEETTVTGMLVEAGCGSHLGPEGPSEDHVACMVRCGRRGEPLGIATSDGVVTITGEWAAANTTMLLELMAERVTATGVVHGGGGERTLQLTGIAPADAR